MVIAIPCFDAHHIYSHVLMHITAKQPVSAKDPPVKIFIRTARNSKQELNRHDAPALNGHDPLPCNGHDAPALNGHASLNNLSTSGAATEAKTSSRPASPMTVSNSNSEEPPSPALVSRAIEADDRQHAVLTAQFAIPSKCKAPAEGHKKNPAESKEAGILHRRSRVSVVEFNAPELQRQPGRLTHPTQHRLHTLTAVQQLHLLDSFRRAAMAFDGSLNCAPGDIHKLLHFFILRRPLLWRAFVCSFVFYRLSELKQMLSGTYCKHIIVR